MPFSAHGKLKSKKNKKKKEQTSAIETRDPQRQREDEKLIHRKRLDRYVSVFGRLVGRSRAHAASFWCRPWRVPNLFSMLLLYSMHSSTAQHYGNFSCDSYELHLTEEENQQQSKRNETFDDACRSIDRSGIAKIRLLLMRLLKGEKKIVSIKWQMRS